MKIVLTGGGTGGHITPILAVARELKQINPDSHIIYIGERNGKFNEMVTDDKYIDEIYSVFAGKFRRYHGESLFKRIFDFETIILNIRDVVYFGCGTIQSFFLMRKLKPDTVLLKGGFVGVPIGLACSVLKLPFVTHDSDAVPGLANKIVSRWASYHATALPASYYSYPKKQVKQVGVLVSKDHQKVTPQFQQILKKRINVKPNMQLLLVTGGSGGAININKAVRTIVEQLLKENKNLYIIHQTGKAKSKIYKNFSHERLRVEELLFPLFEYTGASDVIVSRAGANTLSEAGVQGRACIVIPNPLLTGGHQLQNAKYFCENNAVKVLNEKDMVSNPYLLKENITELLENVSERKLLGDNLYKMTNSNATHKLAMLLLDVAHLSK